MYMYENKYSLLEELYPGDDVDSYNKRICTLLNFIQHDGYITAELNNNNEQVSVRLDLIEEYLIKIMIYINLPGLLWHQNLGIRILQQYQMI